MLSVSKCFHFYWYIHMRGIAGPQGKTTYKIEYFSDGFPFYMKLVLFEDQYFPTTLTTITSSFLFSSGHLALCEVDCHCDLDLYLSDDQYRQPIGENYFLDQFHELEEIIFLFILSIVQLSFLLSYKRTGYKVYIYYLYKL